MSAAALVLLLALGVPGRTPLPPRALHLARELAAPSLARRLRALDAVEASPALLKNPAFGRAAAVAAAEDYNPFWTEAQRRSALLGQGFAEFYGRLTDLLLKAYGLKDPAILRVLALGAYNPQSRMAHTLAGEGSRVVPYLLELWRRGPDYNRAQAVGVLGFLLERQRAGTLRAPLAARDRRLSLRIIRRAAVSSDYAVRDAAVVALGVGGNSRDLALLRRIAASDPVCHAFPHPPNICSHARRAAREIRLRAASPRPRPPARITRAQAAVLRDLYSTNLARRFRAQRELAASRAMLANPAVGRVLAKVLSADTRRFAAAYAGRTPPLSEGWAEVDAELIDLVLRAYGLRDPAILDALALAGYDPRSRLARIIAGQGSRVLPAVRRLLADPLDPWRAQGIGVLAFMLQRQAEGKIRHPLTAAQQKWARGRLRAAARDRSISVRYTAVWALGLVGTPADLAVLRHIASSDPTCHPHHSNDLCSQAQQAIAAIEERAAYHRPRARPPTHRR